MTEHDVRFYSSRSELGGYRIMTVAAAGFAVVFLVLGFLGIGEVIAGQWFILALLAGGVLFALFPAAWSRHLQAQRPGDDVHAPLNPSRAEHFWYERGVSDETHSRDNLPPEADTHQDVSEKRTE